MIYAVKALGGGRIEAEAVRYGSPLEPDRSAQKDFFTPATDLMLDEWGWPRPILLEHMVTPEAEAAGAVGSWLRATKHATGVTLTGQLKTNHPLYPQIDRDIRAGKYFLSSDSAPHLVKRKPHTNGTNELVRWGLLTASLTKSPAEHRLLPVAAIKHLALKQGARHSAKDQEMVQTVHDHAVALGAVCGAGKSDRQRALELRARALALELDPPAETFEAKRARLLRKVDRLQRS